MSENENMGQNPRVFISYSWDSPEHRLWVESFAQELRKSGIDARLDAWRDESQSIDDFMMVELERADFILAICTPQFKQKIVENAEGTATASGFEVGTAAALRRMGGKDVIPVLRSGAWTEAAPSSLLSYRFYDFTQSDVGDEFTQLRDRLLGHIRRPPELGKASGPAAAPELPDIFAQGESPDPQPTTAPTSAATATASVPRSGPPPQRQHEQQPQTVVSAPAAGYSKGKVWSVVGAILIGLVVLWNLIPDVEEPVDGSAQTMANFDEPTDSSGSVDNAGAPEISENDQQPENSQGLRQEDTSEALLDDSVDWAALLESMEEQPAGDSDQSGSDGLAPEDRWTYISSRDGCGIEKEVAPDSWVQVVYEVSDGAYTFFTADYGWGEHIQTEVLHESAVVFQFDDDYSTAFIADVVGYEYDGISGAFTFVGEELVENLSSYYFLNVYLNVDPYLDNQILSFDLTGSTPAAEQLLACVQNL